MRSLPFLLVMFSLLNVHAGEPDDLSKFQRQIQPSGEQAVYARLKVNNGTVHLNRDGEGRLFNGEFWFSERPPLVAYEVVGDEGRLDVRLSKQSRKGKRDSDHIPIDWDERYENECYLTLSDQLPIELEMDFGFVKGELALGGLMLENCEIKTAVSQTLIDFDAPNPLQMAILEIENGVGDLELRRLGNANFRSFDFEAGAGSYELDFSGDLRADAEVYIEIGVGSMDIFIPRSLGVRIRVDKSFLSSFQIEEVYKAGGDEYTNDRWKSDAPQLDMRIDAGLAKVDVIWID